MQIVLYYDIFTSMSNRYNTIKVINKSLRLPWINHMYWSYVSLGLFKLQFKYLLNSIMGKSSNIVFVSISKLHHDL